MRYFWIILILILVKVNCLFAQLRPSLKSEFTVTKKMHILEYTKNGDSILTSFYNVNELQFYNLETGEKGRPFVGLNRGNKAVDVSEELKIVALGGYGSNLDIWNYSSSPKKLKTLKINGRSIDLIQFINDDFFITGTDNGDLCIWDAQILSKVECFSYKNKIRTACLSDNNKLYVSGYGGKVLIYDLSKKDTVASIDTQEDYISNVFISRDKKSIITAGSEGIIRFWDINSLTLRNEINTGRKWIIDSDYSPKYECLVFSNISKEIGLISLKNQKSIKYLTDNGSIPINVEFNPVDREFAVLSNGGKISLWSY